ncbi:hypothetical protein MBAV_001843, partial [Candidatus Magnetobacterium bavaricum]
DWRVPSIQELYTLCRTDGTTTGFDNLYAIYCNGTAVDVGSLLNGEGFTNMQSNYYWSSTSFANDTSHAWVVSMFDAYVYAGVKSVHFYVLPVRSGH